MPGLLEPSGGDERPTAVGGVEIGAVVMFGGRCSVDHGALHGRSRVERGHALGTGAPAGERAVFVWVAFRGGEFHGLTVSEARVDAARGSVFRDPVAQSNAMAAAARGTVDVLPLAAAERAALRAFLQSCEPVRWDRAARAFKEALV
jgi:hypothetical protein